MPKRLLRCQSAAVRYLDFEQISLIHSPFRRAFTIISMNFILAFNTEAKLKTRQLPSKVVHRTRTFPKRKNAVERTDERAAIFVLNAPFRLQSRSQSPRAFWSAPRHGVLVLTKRHVGSGNEIVPNCSDCSFTNRTHAQLLFSSVTWGLFLERPGNYRAR